MISFKGQLVNLRAPEPEDAKFMYIWENDEENWAWSNTLTPFSHYSLDQFIEETGRDIYATKQFRFMIDNKFQKPIGCVDLFEFDPYHLRAGVGILIYEHQDRRNGFALESLNILAQYAFETLGIKQLFCHIAKENISSQKLFEKAGYQKVGELKQWHRRSVSTWVDVCVYQLHLG